MYRRFDTMSEELENELRAEFPFGVKTSGAFYFDEKSKDCIMVHDYLVIIQAASWVLQGKVLELLQTYVSNCPQNWIVLQKMGDRKVYSATTPAMDKIKDILVKMDILSGEFEIKNSIYFKAELSLDFEGQAVNFSYHDTTKFYLQTDEDVARFNYQYQEQLRTASQFKTDILNLLQCRYPNVYWAKSDILSFSGQNYVFKVLKIKNGWHIYFFKNWSPSGIIQTQDLHFSKDQVLKLAEGYQMKSRPGTLLKLAK